MGKDSVANVPTSSNNPSEEGEQTRVIAPDTMWSEESSIAKVLFNTQKDN